MAERKKILNEPYQTYLQGVRAVHPENREELHVDSRCVC